MKKLYMRPAIRTEEVLMRYFMKDTSKLPVNDEDEDEEIYDHDGLLVKPEDEYWWPEQNMSLWEESN
jgi:hypothetical protein